MDRLKKLRQLGLLKSVRSKNLTSIIWLITTQNRCDEALPGVIDSYDRPIIDEAIENALKEKSTKRGKGLFGLKESIPTY